MLDKKAKWALYLHNRYMTIKQFVDRLKDKPCIDCRGIFHRWQMDFDHVRGNKKFNVCQPGSRSIQTVIDEIAKCDLVCANCHRDRTHKRGEYRYYARKNPVLLG